MIKKLVKLCIIVTFMCSIQINNYIAYASDESIFNINSEAAFLLDGSTGDVLYSKNGDQLMYPASLTKILTAIIAIEEGNLKDQVTVSENARNVDGTRVYLEVGEQVTLLKLIQGLLINSGNDAGVAIAEYFDGSEEKFAERMNKFSKEKINVQHSQFQNPHGLFDPEHYTTASDMAEITKYAMQNDTFREIFGTVELDWKGTGWETTLYTHNELLRWYDGVTGGKTGYVDESGHTLITSATKGNLNLIAVVLKASSKNLAYDDTTTLFDYGFENFIKNVIPKNKQFLDEQNNEYILSEDVTYTKKSNEDVSLSTDEQGVLSILGEQNRIINTYQLESVDMNEKKKDGEQTETAENEEGSLLITSSMFVIPLFVFFIMFSVYRKRKKNVSYYKEVN
ncbi:D-alanyl-D-alanine carboxypeptidase family protein [Cytobacillus sp. IB215316]|uniref:D-alanyl-D-alanine carboxypeptidase family protein n=1 Tax=Cytobacillus sp. IB215316 TaxID=3097354 RepID=UPI002A1262CD|nr:D-alanyl-D-alanine carboxypeptidase family protein [Cytobacillus sp. IB215316]MDX8360044.1 D-alanyl-D-alanine carboxypeptidase family protein [Cytobacillus sp. IB215316]